jgi:hypothetical protein
MSTHAFLPVTAQKNLKQQRKIKNARGCKHLDARRRTITVFIPMTWKRCGGRKVIIAPDGGDAWAPAKSRPDETLIRALARAHRWKRLLEEGKYGSATEIAEAEKIGRSFVNRLLRLTLLAPDIQEAILEGRQAKGMQLEEVTRGMPGAWGSRGRLWHRQILDRPATWSLLDLTLFKHGFSVWSRRCLHVLEGLAARGTGGRRG